MQTGENPCIIPYHSPTMSIYLSRISHYLPHNHMKDTQAFSIVKIHNSRQLPPQDPILLILEGKSKKELWHSNSIPSEDHAAILSPVHPTFEENELYEHKPTSFSK